LIDDVQVYNRAAVSVGNPVDHAIAALLQGREFFAGGIRRRLEDNNDIIESLDDARYRSA
jgi:hypothetical protein